MFIFSVSYTRTEGRKCIDSKETLKVRIHRIHDQKEFFQTIRSMMKRQCLQVATSQYLQIELCSLFKIEDCSTGKVRYHKFYKSFFDTVHKFDHRE